MHKVDEDTHVISLVYPENGRFTGQIYKVNPRVEPTEKGWNKSDELDNPIFSDTVQQAKEALDTAVSEQFSHHKCADHGCSAWNESPYPLAST